MRSSNWLRFGLTSLMVVSAGMAAALVACSDDDDNKGSPTTPAVDSGSDTSTPVVDSGTDAPKPPPKELAKLQLVNAATDLGAANPPGLVRFCYQIAPNVFAPLPPLPDEVPGLPIPGVPIGTGGAIPATGADLSALSIAPVVINALALAQRGIVRGDAGTAGMTCGDILGADKDAGGQGPLVENVDYWTLAPIPAGSFLAEKSYVLVLTGCPSDTALAEEDRAKCGADFEYTGNPGKGNLQVRRFEVDRATKIDAAKIGTQFIHASAAGAGALAGLGLSVVPGYVLTDGGAPKSVVEGDAGVPYGSVTPLVQVEGVDVSSWAFSANVYAPPENGLAIPLPFVEQFSALPPNTYKNGAAYTFIAIGDPSEPPTGENDAPNPKTFHYLGLPNDPVVATFK